MLTRLPGPRTEPATMLRQVLGSCPDRTAVDDGAQSVTYVELARDIASYAIEFRALAPVPSRVLICLPGGSDFVAVMAALSQSAHEVVMLDPHVAGLTDMVIRIAPDVIVAHAATLERVRESLDCTLLRAANGRLSRVRACARNGGRRAVRGITLCTSGTTGAPKLVTHHWSGYGYSARLLGELLRLDGRDSLLHHLAVQRGAGFFLWAGLSLGAVNRIVPSKAADLPALLTGTGSSAVFTMSQGMHEIDRALQRGDTFRDLRTLYYSSAPVTTALKFALTEHFGDRLVQDYGLSEVPEPLAVLSGADHLSALGRRSLFETVGRPVFPDRVRVVNGQVEIKSPAMFTGYLDSPERTERSLDGAWFRTGDGGVWEDGGFLRLTGRLDGTARISGEDLDIAELTVALTALSDVEEAVVALVPDDRRGQAPAVTVTLRPGGKEDEASLRRHLNSAVHPLLQPVSIDITNTLESRGNE